VGRSATVAIFLFGWQLLASATINSAESKVGNFRSGATKFWVEQAVQDAAHRLHSPECQRVLSDFSDPLGTPLEARLAALGVSAEAYLTKWVYFLDGSDQPQCDPRLHIVAFTQRGRRVVFICPPRGIDAAFATARPAGIVIIHEMLHSLGLGENPPTSRHITQTVVRRCGG